MNNGKQNQVFEKITYLCYVTLFKRTVSFKFLGMAYGAGRKFY